MDNPTTTEPTGGKESSAKRNNSSTSQAHPAPEDLKAQVEAHAGITLKKVGNQFKGPCPTKCGPNSGGTDRFRINAAAKMFCNQCCPNGKDLDAVDTLLEAAIGKPKSKPKSRPNGQAGADPMDLKPTDGDEKTNGKAAPAGFTRRWTYTNLQGETVQSVRLGKGKGKRVWRDPAGVKGPFLPLGCDLKGKTAIIVEGEITRDAIIAAGLEGVCWLGGSDQWHLTAWDRLECADAVLWPDADGTGRKAMEGVGCKLHGRFPIRIVEPPKEVKRGWDAADASTDQIHRLIEAAEDWKPSAEVAAAHSEGEGIVSNNADGFRQALELLGFKTRFNVRNMAYEYQAQKAPWTKMTDGWEQSTRAELGRKIRCQLKGGKTAPFSIGTPTFRDWTKANCYDDGEVDPFVLYLESRPTWDGKERLAHYPTEELFDVSEEYRSLAIWGGIFLFAGSVKRALTPGFKLDESPVFVGPKGMGKSTLAREILPPGKQGNEWFGDEFSMAANPQKQLEAIKGKVVVEMGEMVGARKADVKLLFAFLTRRVDNSVRLPYAHHPPDMERRNIFFGTANDAECLPNDPNLRRFVVAHVKPKGGKESAYKNICKYMDENRDQLWAEALALVKGGFNPRLPDDLKPAAEEAAEQARIHDSHLADLLAETGAKLEKKARKEGGLTMTEIVFQLDLKDQFEINAPSLTRRLGGELVAHGWERLQRCRRAGKLVRLWMPDRTE